MAENPFDGSYGTGETEYERYLRTPELLGLQKPASKRLHKDELLFQSVHQVEEIWMKLIVHQMGEAVAHLAEARFAQAVAAIQRAHAAQELCVSGLRMFEHMPPNSYIDIRKGLGRGSGLDSPGYNRMNEIAPTIWKAFESAVDAAGGDLVDMYENPASQPDLFAVAEALCTYDSLMIRFKREHIMVVRRIIGMGTASLRGGNPIDMLERSASLTYFPMLWAVRDRLFIDFKAGELAT
jgi:tryptophan 2,3-dioxygenase